MGKCKERDIFQQLEMIFQTDRVKAEKEFGDSFYKYYQRYFQDNARLKGMLNESKHIMCITNAEGKKVLDLGCGFGLTAIQLKALGAKEVVGLDVDRNKKKCLKNCCARCLSLTKQFCR
jgi:cyclopropane fatty-acyl-phospholipid synthase-like methyltransferase